MRLLNDAPNDPVTELLASLKVHSSVYCLSDLGAPWGFVVDGADTAKFHLVLEGACWLQAGTLDPVRLGTGELAILPRGERHTMSDELDSPITGLDQLIADHPLDADARLRPRHRHMGSAQITLPALDIAAPAIFWAPQESAIDVFHHVVYAAATGIAYQLLSNGRDAHNGASKAS
jgi:hypothetical protein